jgi:hypothetical protein
MNKQEQLPATTHYHIADNSTGFREWLDSKEIKWAPNGHYTTIPLEENDIFRLGMEFGVFRKWAVPAPAKKEMVQVKDGLAVWEENSETPVEAISDSELEQLAIREIPDHPHPDMAYPASAVTTFKRECWIDGYKYKSAFPN